MNQPEDDAQLGWDGAGAATPPADANIPATVPPAPAEPTMAQPPAPPVAPAPPQPLGVPAPLPGAPAPPAPQGPLPPAPAPQVPAPPNQTQAFPAAAQQPPMAPAPQFAPAAAPAPGASSKGLWITLAVLCCVVVAGAVVITILLMRGPETAVSEMTQPTSPTSSTTSTSTTTTAAPTTPPPATEPAPPPPQAVPSVGSLPSGLLCKDLAAKGLGYADAVRYYKREGYPDRMDADYNGIPCETVYSASAVQAYWGTVRSGSSLGLGSGLLCADLHNAGYDYGSAVEYWIADGFPDRMDADHNGIPCETVYSAVEVRGFWETVG